jgi:lipid-binding SYLF domain-containing protein
MRRAVISTLVVILAGVPDVFAGGALSTNQTKRIQEAATVLTEIHKAPDKDIPKELWDMAECVIVVPGLKKGAFIFGGEYGAGIMSCRRNGTWGAPIFMQVGKGSWGLQIGAEQTDLVLLVMNRRGLDKLLDDKVSLGADASVAAGPVGRTGAAATDAKLSAEMLSYSRSQGVFAGIDLSGGVLRPDKEALARAYGPNVSAREVVTATQRVVALEQAKPFLSSLRQETRATTGRK